MTDLKITLFAASGRKIGKCSFMTRNNRSLMLFGFQGDLEKIRKERNVEIHILYKGISYVQILGLVDEISEFKDGENIEILTNDETIGYNQKTIDIFRDWDEKINVQWRYLSDDDQRSWLVACLYYSGLPTSILAGYYEFDLGLLKSTTELYCMLGEVFFGSRGYFGQDIDGLYDCMIGLPELSRRNTEVVFRNLFHVKDMELREGFKDIIQVFESHFFKVKIT